VISLSLNRINHNSPKALMLIQKRKAQLFTNPDMTTLFPPLQDAAVDFATSQILKVGPAFIEGKDRIAPSCYQCHGENWNED
jgi:hypothetical protein